MAISARGKQFFTRLRALLSLQRFNHTRVAGGTHAQFNAEMNSCSVFDQGKIDISKWRKVDSRTLGITRHMISSPSWIVLKILQAQGFEAYLVGGCVRDLILHRIPKDFDVITTAGLRQIKKQFHRAVIVGRRFPICMVHVKGSVVEVSSFETVAKHAEDKEKFLFSQMPRGCDKKDLVRWRNCMHRDFTINSLFFDPFVNKIYDYANGMMDLRSLKLRTLVPAHLSFQEDCARILRALRIAARLGLTFSKETESAILKLSSSILRLDKSRIMMELNYMLSYGAAESSLCLLKRFNLLEMLLPFHAAYLAQHANQFGESSLMLMKLFFNVDKLTTCDRPSDCNLWVGLLAFHLALVNSPQDPLVVWTFASVLYHGEWEEGVKFAREHAKTPLGFVPEISKASDFISDNELAERVSQLASLVQHSLGALTETDCLHETMTRFPDLQCSGLVFVPRRTAESVAQLFSVLVHDAVSYKKKRKNFEIDYNLLGKGTVAETRFVVGKVILDTMRGGIVQGNEVVEGAKDHFDKFDPQQRVEFSVEISNQPTTSLEKNGAVGEKDEKCSTQSSSVEERQKRGKKQKTTGKWYNVFVEQGFSEKLMTIVKESSEEEAAEKREDIVENINRLEEAKKHQHLSNIISDCISLDEVTKKKKQKIEVSQLLLEEIDMMQKHASETKECQLLPQEKKEGKQKVVKDKKRHEILNVGKTVEKCVLHKDSIKQKEKTSENEEQHSQQMKEVTDKCEKSTQEVTKKRSRPLLSNLFR